MIVGITGLCTLVCGSASFFMYYIRVAKWASPWFLGGSVTIEAFGALFFKAEDSPYNNFVFVLMGVVQVLPFLVGMGGYLWLRYAHKKAEAELQRARVCGC